MRRLSAALASGLLAGLAACASAPASVPVSPASAKVTGEVFWRERIMLPPTTVVIVSLQDVSQMDAPAKLIAAQRLEGRVAPPVDFELRYDPAKVVETHRYTVSARVEVDGKLRFVSDTAYPVITHGAPTTAQVLVVGVPQ